MQKSRATQLKNRRKDYFRQSFGTTPDFMQTFEKYTPEALDGYAKMREAIFAVQPKGQFDRKFYELLIIAINCTRGTIEGARLHVKPAIDAGATLEEIHRVLAVVAFSCGMPTYATYGYRIMQYAEEYAKTTAQTKT